MEVNGRTVNDKFFKELHEKLGFQLDRMKAGLGKIILNPVVKRRIKQLSLICEICYELYAHSRVIQDSKDMYWNNSFTRDYDTDDIKEAKKIQKKIKRLLSNGISHFTMDSKFNYRYGIGDSGGSLRFDYCGQQLYLRELFVGLNELIDELIEYYKESIREEKKQKRKANRNKTQTSSTSSKKKPTTNHGSTNSSNYSSFEHSVEFLQLTQLFMNTIDIVVRELFAPYESKDKELEISYDDKLREYEEAFNTFVKFYVKLSDVEKMNQIKKMKRETTGNDRMMIFGKSEIDEIYVGSLSPKSLIRLINKKVRYKMCKEKPDSYYSRSYDHITMNPLNREYEICNVTRYMEIGEIVSIYHEKQNYMLHFESEGLYLDDLQRNFALAIYKTLVMRGYIRDDEKMKDSILYEICVKLLKDERCLFRKCSNTKNIDLITIINSKDYDIIKEAFKKESSLGRLMEKMESLTNMKGKSKNAKKL